MKARDNIIAAIAANARKLDNDDLLLLLIHSFALIDQAGIKNLRKNYNGPKGLVVIRLVASTAECKRRMAARGDSADAIAARSAFDTTHSEQVVGTDLIMYNDDLNSTAERLHKFIERMENGNG